MSIIQHLHRYRATIRIRRDQKFGAVKPEIASYDGARFETMALWFIDCSDDEFANKAYDGEWAMETPRDWPVRWVASGDLVNIEPIANEKGPGIAEAS